VRRDGKELYYHFGNTFYALNVKTDGAAFEAGIPRPCSTLLLFPQAALSGVAHLWSPGTASGSWFSRRLRNGSMSHWRLWSTGANGLDAIRTMFGNHGSIPLRRDALVFIKSGNDWRGPPPKPHRRYKWCRGGVPWRFTPSALISHISKDVDSS
jgi:hypothetical protein